MALLLKALKTLSKICGVQKPQKKTGRILKSLKRRNVKFNQKMKNLKMFAAMFAVVLLLASCAVTMPVNATSNPVGTKVGTSKATGYLGVFFFGQDASIQTAAKNAGITKISTVDMKQTNVLGIIWTYETIVTGE